jgi:hypothetical protein
MSLSCEASALIGVETAYQFHLLLNLTTEDNDYLVRLSRLEMLDTGM